MVDSNTGHYNTGRYNTGLSNTGHWNAGHYNTGHWNTGHWNTGCYNTGDCNTGRYNAGHYNTGCFNTDTPKMRLFNKELNMTVEEFHTQYDLNAYIELTEWVKSENMTDQEKEDNPKWETTSGYLKQRTFHEACHLWWDENPEDHERFLTLPGFDPDIFQEITGIKTQSQIEKNTIVVDGILYEKAKQQ